MASASKPGRWPRNPMPQPTGRGHKVTQSAEAARIKALVQQIEDLQAALNPAPRSLAVSLQVYRAGSQIRQRDDDRFKLQNDRVVITFGNRKSKVTLREDEARWIADNSEAVVGAFKGDAS